MGKDAGRPPYGARRGHRDEQHLPRGGGRRRSAFVAAYPGLTGDERTGFAVAIGVVGALDVVLLVRAILSHPGRDAVHAYVRLNGTGVLATF